MRSVEGISAVHGGEEVNAAAGDQHQTRRQGRQQLLPGRGRQLREVVHNWDQPFGGQQGLH
jgi:hypothetical protein